MRKSIAIAAIVVAALAGAVLGTGGSPAIAQQPGVEPPRICFGPNNPCLAPPRLTETMYPVRVHCTSTGQMCSPAFTVSVETIRVLGIEFTASPQCCSDIRLHIFLDGQRLAVTTNNGQQPTTTFLGPGQSTRDANFIAKFTDMNAPTRYQLSIQAEGRVGGCNAGSLSSWGGTLLVRTFTRP